MLSAASQSVLQDHLSAGAVIITANRRLQRTLTAAAASLAFQAAPPIYAADDWLQQLWLELQDQAYPGTDVVLLSQFQSRRLWQEVVEKDPPATGLISPAQLAQQAEAAARLADDWMIPLDDPSFEYRDEYRYFRRWHQQFEQLLQERRLATPQSCRSMVEEAFAQSALPRPPSLVLYGFEDLPPRLQAIFETAAPTVHNWPSMPEGDTRRCLRAAASDAEAEIRAAALWSRQLIEADPQQRIGIIVPQLSARRGMVERIFTEVYEPGSWFPAKQRFAPPFNFSAGMPLASTPLVADALLLLNLNHKHIKPDDWRRLLLSPFWGGAHDNSRCQLLIQLNRSTKIRLAVSEIRRMAEQAQADEEWPLADALANFAELARRQPARQSYSGWAHFFDKQLQVCQWPGSRGLDSPEYQQQQHFYQVLDQLAQCDNSLASPIGLSEALHALKELCEAAVFQIQTPESPIQILGILEGAGLQFDACWITDMADSNWPPAPKPSPFIPLNLQVALGVPHCNAERELDYARRLTHHLAQAADEVVFSWPANDGDVHLQASQLISSHSTTAIETLAPNATPLQEHRERIAQSAEFEELDCGKAPPWPDLRVPLPGGTGVLKMQAACPFNAFAIYRLGAHSRERPVPGLTGAERGTVLHDLMARLWTSLQTYEKLVATSADELHQLVADTVDTTLSPWRLKRSDIMHPHFYRLEQERLHALAMAWLELERERPSFSVVATEAEQTLHLDTTRGTAQIIGRVDRIDELASGKRMVIDYKTGRTSPSQWQGERPADLQLALYALAHEDDVVAIAFSEINAKRVSLSGVGQLAPEDGIIRGLVAPNKFRQSELPDDWSATLAYWRERAHRLVDEFVEGDCPAVFFSKSEAQYYRHLEPLNRMLEDIGDEG